MSRIPILILALILSVLPGWAAESPRISVTVERVCPMDIQSLIEAPAEIEPYDRVQLAAKLMAYVLAVGGEEGTAVASGEVVLVLDDRDIQANLEMARESLKEAEAAREAAEAQRDFAAKQMERVKNLVSRSATNKAAFDQAEAGFLAASGGLQQTLAKMGQSRAAIANASVMLSYTKLASPFTGVITRKLTSPGNLTAPGQPLLTIERVDRLYITGSVNEKDVSDIKIGGNARVRIDALDRDFDATIFAIIPSGDPVTRSFRVRVVLENPENLVKPGMFAKLQITRLKKDGVVAVPRRAILHKDGKNLVFGYDPVSGTVHRRMVELGLEGRDYIEVKDGDKVAACSHVVVQGQEFLADGDRVQVRNMLEERPSETLSR